MSAVKTAPTGKDTLSDKDSTNAENKDSSEGFSESSSESDDSDDEDKRNQASSAVKTFVTGKDIERLRRNAGKGRQLPTRKNKIASMTSMLPKTSERVESQMLYYPCFSTFARHKQPPVSTDGNPGIEFDIILKTISSFTSGRSLKKDSIAEKNAEVASWWTTRPMSSAGFFWCSASRICWCTPAKSPVFAPNPYQQKLRCTSKI